MESNTGGFSAHDEMQFKVGDEVKKVGGDYTFDGSVVASFRKRSGAIRLVVEDSRGILHIFSETNLQFGR